MEYLFMGALSCIGQACCWYNIYRCCGCIEEGRQHVEIEKQIVVKEETKPQGNPKDSPNPFINPEVAKHYN